MWHAEGDDSSFVSTVWFASQAPRINAPMQHCSQPVYQPLLEPCNLPSRAAAAVCLSSLKERHYKHISVWTLEQPTKVQILLFLTAFFTSNSCSWLSQPLTAPAIRSYSATKYRFLCFCISFLIYFFLYAPFTGLRLCWKCLACLCNNQDFATIWIKLWQLKGLNYMLPSVNTIRPHSPKKDYERFLFIGLARFPLCYTCSAAH